MKHQIFLAFLTLAIAGPIAAQQIANGGFENWTVQSLFENPDDWETPNGQAPGLVNITKVSGSAGAFATRMETVVYDMDTIFGFVLLGEIDNDIPTAGVPFTTEIAQIQGDVRHDILPNDTAFILFIAWSGGASVAEEFIPFTGSQSTWSAFSQPLTLGPVTPDSVLFGMASSNPFDETFNSPGSWVEIDNIRLTSPNVPTPDQLPNNSFENWSDVEVEDPDSWNTVNSLTQSFLGALITKSSDAAVGMYSARFENALTDDGGTISAVLTNGDIDSFGATGGVPYAAVPHTLTGQCKWMPSGQDTAFISLQLLSNGMIIGTALYGLTQAVPTWTAFNQNVTTVGTPDTMLISVISGFNSGSVLMLDDLDLTGGTVGYYEMELNEVDVRLYPNPAQDKLNIVSPESMEMKQGWVMDVTGKRVLELAGNELMTPITIGHLPAGLYFLHLESNQGRSSIRFTKE